MEYSLKDKVVVITGGASGIGCEIADKYLEEGAKVAVIIDVNETQGKGTEKNFNEKYGEGRSDFIKCDVTTNLEATYKVIIEKYKTVDVLVLNAGIADDSVPRKMIDILVTSVIEWAFKFLELMRRDKGGNGGTIIINSSIFGFRIVPYAPVYQASKFAVLGFAKSIGHDYHFEKTAVRVLTICPGFTETNLTKNVYDPELKKLVPDQDLIKFVDSQPWQKVEAVGNAAVEVFKCAKSGTVWIIEGGKLTELV
ncbi:15-hydroxyprostaglandin dehydrogenase [NAD(+)]-like [Anticarsia gemmatalis]|uniref:15-hydroxyprostaglandin dehydrogenase [NAD(+)]-like n=1 Tax=Anticarsia gemmatalis TaxID=129554 RepID=UPI003F774178